MSKKITKEMVDILNEMLSDMNCIFRYELDAIDGDAFDNPHMNIVLVSDKFVDSYIVNLSKNYLNWLETTFKERWGITLCYNNTGSVIWSKEGWGDLK